MTAQFAIINSSELFKQGRWDAGFHLLNKEYAERAAVLAVTMSKDEVVALLSDDDAVPTAVLQHLAPLVRGGYGTPSRDQILKAVNEYPFLSLAIVKDKGADQMDQLKNDLDKKVEKMGQAQQTLQSAGVPIAGLSPIAHETRGLLSNNKFVGGVVYFDGDTLSIPAETSRTAYVADCWVIDLADWTGPEVIDALVAEGNVPVPRRHEDLGQPVGMVESLADHRQNYGLGWGPRDRH